MATSTRTKPTTKAPAPTAETTTTGPDLLRWNNIAAMLGVSRRWLERAVAAGEFPRPDKSIRRMHWWRRATVEQWLSSR